MNAAMLLIWLPGAGDSTADRQFKRLHLKSVLINAAHLLLLIGISFVPD